MVCVGDWVCVLSVEGLVSVSMCEVEVVWCI